MKPPLDRRAFLGALGSIAEVARETEPEIPVVDGVPRVDYHAHLEAGITLDRALALSAQRQVRFGLLQHAGAKDPASPDRITSDEGIEAWVRSLEGKPAFKGIQAEGLHWRRTFSKRSLAKLDYILSEALTMPDKSGKLVRLWTPEFHCDDRQDFMDRYVDFHVRVMSAEPIDILANPTYLPDALVADFDSLWTEKRMRTIVDAAVKHRIAIEINSKYSVPRIAFLQMARDAGLKFSFGSNSHAADTIGDIEYGVKMYRRLGLSLAQFFRPAPAGRKAVERHHA